ncbi:hypothetical protein, partial [Bordetella pertussis]|uniref:hypothetical protein n=1 Tax=Bordetella pertussis TaxID=520 RepID=UPI0018A6B2E1
ATYQPSTAGSRYPSPPTTQRGPPDRASAGSTYVHGAAQALTGAEGQRVNLDKAAGLLGQAPAAFASLQPGSLPGWAGWRAVLPGR